MIHKVMVHMEPQAKVEVYYSDGNSSRYPGQELVLGWGWKTDNHIAWGYTVQIARSAVREARMEEAVASRLEAGQSHMVLIESAPL